MVYCSNCGKELGNGAKFCTECGTPTGRDIKFENEKRKFVYEGEIRKCPNCGEVINSFISICPACGFELNSKRVSSVLQDFIKEINECEQTIANNPQAGKTGWASWSKGKRTWWVILNIFFVCIPLAIYVALPLLMVKSTPKLTKEEKRMASLVENFPFPNDRESILSALIFAKEKIDFISKETINRKNAYWMRIWCAKAEQLKQKADILFPDDSIVKESYAEITSDEAHVNKILKVKAIIGLVILVIATVFLVIRYGQTSGGVIDDTDYSATFEWQTNGLFAQIPEPTTNNGHIVWELEEQIYIELYNVSSENFESYVKACRDVGFTVDITKNDMVFYASDSEGYGLSIFYDDDTNVMKVYVDSYDIPDENPSGNQNTGDQNEQSSDETDGLFGDNEAEPLNIKNFSLEIPDYYEEEGSKNEYLQYYAEKGDKVVMLSIAYPEETDDDYDVSFDGLYADNENMIEAVGAMFTDGDVFDNEVFETEYGVKGILYRFTYNQKIDWLTKVDGSGYCFCFPSEDDRRWFYVVLLHTNNVASGDYKDDYMGLISSIKEKP